MLKKIATIMIAGLVFTGCSKSVSKEDIEHEAKEVVAKPAAKVVAKAEAKLHAAAAAAAEHAHEAAGHAHEAAGHVHEAAAKTAEELKAKAAAAADAVNIASVDVATLAAKLKSNQAIPCDANGEKTRSEYGVIPGAKLLSHFENYDPAKELGTDKSANYVFYCSNTQCGASKAAAQKALAAGYTNVNILPAGVAGWKEAGQTTKAM